MVPQPDVLDGEAVAIEGGRGQPVLGGKILLLDPVEAVGLPGHPDVVLDVRPLGLQLVWRHLEALEEGGVDAEPAYPDHGQHHEARHQEAPAAATDLEHAGRRAEERDRGEGPQSREGGVDVGVGSAKDHAARRVEKLVAVEPEADGPEDQGEGGQAQEVIAGAHRHAGALGRQHQAAQEHIGGNAQDEGAHHEGQGPAVDEAPEGQLEDEEGEVAPEEGICHAERRGIEIAQEHVPRSAGPDAGEERDDGDGGNEHAPDQGLEHGAARQPELIVELPQHVGSRRARGHPEIGVEEDEDDAARPQHQPAPEGQHGGEDLRVADLAVPEPVGVEGHGLADAREEDEGQEKPQAQSRRTLSYRQGGGPPAPGRVLPGATRSKGAGATCRASRRTGTPPGRASARQSARPWTPASAGRSRDRCPGAPRRPSFPGSARA